MAKIILGKRPESFFKTVSFPMLDGSIGTIGITYKYRTRTEFGTFIDELRAAAGAVPVDLDEAQSVEVMHARTLENNVDYIMRAVTGWDLEVDFDRESVRELGDELPAAMNAVIDSYRIACTEGRLGN
jgi:hypothetical protein